MFVYHCQMNIKKPLIWLSAILSLLLILTVILLSRSSFELTPSGIHKSLFIPVTGGKFAKIRTYSGSGDAAAIPGFLDGPVIRPEAGGGWSAAWFCEDRVFQQHGTAPQLTIDCAGKRRSFATSATQHQPPAAILPMPAKVAVLSDIEGNIAFLDKALLELGVTDSAGAWKYADGHLVIVGDAVDRGRDVFAVLWRLYTLAQQAKDAGGALHLVLGNHEQYMLRGKTTSADNEHLYALGQLGGARQAFAADTVIGQWLRAQPVILKLGRVLFTHGGISRQTVASGLSIPQLNEAMRAYWDGKTDPSPALDAVIGPGGLTQYRGYFDAGQGLDTMNDIDRALRQFDATTIVVGHTLVDKVTMLHDGRVIGIDVNTNEAADEALVFENGKPRVVTVADRGLPPEERARGRMRALALTEGGDWQALGSAVQRNYELARLPHPY